MMLGKFLQALVAAFRPSDTDSMRTWLTGWASYI